MSQLQISLMISCLILTIISQIVFASAELPMRNVWTCDQSTGNCIRHKTNNVSEQFEYHAHSLELCGMVCGPYRSLWPQPTGITRLGNRLVAINLDQLHFYHDPLPADTQTFLDGITNIFMSNLQSDQILCPDCIYKPTTSNVLIKLHALKSDLTLSWTTDESYTLDIKTDEDGERVGNLITDATVTVHINATNMFGIRHGLETLSQLIAHTMDDDRHMSVIINSAKLSDRPIYAHRGLLLDTARNFLPLKDLRRTLDGMAVTKLNVLHLHATDSQSFPLMLPSVPMMALYGAYSQNQTYTMDDLNDIVAYGKYRGVRVLIEIDAPSHAGNGWQWGPSAGIGSLTVCGNQQPWRSFCIQPPCGQLNPANANVFHVLQRIYTDVVAAMAPGEALHMGGDEVFFDCWNSSQEVVSYMSELGLGRERYDFLQLWAKFQESALRAWDAVTDAENAAGPSSKAILWSSHLTQPTTIQQFLPKDRYIIQTWVPSTDEMPQQLLNLGYELIISTKNAWYFDHGFWGQTAYYAWSKAYNNRIQRHPGVLGGEACVWSELIDGSNLDDRIWPRASAVGERLWSDPKQTAAQTLTRMYRHRERLVRRGMAAEAVAPKWCIQNEGECK